MSLDGDLRYNPLNNSLDPYAQAFNIASIITAIWGKGKEPFWQQSYTDLVRYVIILHRIRDEYVTLLDLFRSVLSSGALERMLVDTGRSFTASSFVGVGKPEYLKHEPMLKAYGFAWNEQVKQYLACWSEELESTLVQKTDVKASMYRRRIGDLSQRLRWESVQYWYWEHWKFFRTEVKTSIVQGIAVFLSLFETDPDVRRVFCPPKSLYEGRTSSDDPRGRVLPPFDELIESGKVVGLNFPSSAQPGAGENHRHHDEDRLPAGSATAHPQDGC